MNREAVYSALFTLLSSAPGLITTSRTLRHWSDVQPSEMPALFQAQGDQSVSRQLKLPMRWELMADIWVYVSTDGDLSPGEVINPIVDAICSAINPYPSERQTLGGIVYDVYVAGSIKTSSGTLGNIEAVMIPVCIIAF